MRPLWLWPKLVSKYWNGSSQWSKKGRLLFIMVALGRECNLCVYFIFFPFLALLCFHQIGLLSPLMTSARQLWPAPSFNSLGTCRLTRKFPVKIWKKNDIKKNNKKKTFPVQDLTVQIPVFTYINNTSLWASYPRGGQGLSNHFFFKWKHLFRTGTV